MKKLILLLYVALATAAFAQKDSLIVLNKEVSIAWHCSQIIDQDISSYITLSLIFNSGSKFKTLLAPQNKIVTKLLPCSCPNGTTAQCYTTTIFSYKGHEGNSVNYPKKLFLKYTKKKKTYTIL